MMAIRQRARSDEQKAQRRQAILDAAGRSFGERSFEELNLSELAAEVGLSKAALYRYFRNKEVLFLALYQRELARLDHNAMEQDWRDGIAAGLTRLLTDHPLFCGLSAILHTVLERQLELAEARAFKEELYAHFAGLAHSLCAQMKVSVEAAMGLLLQVQAALIGCWHLSHPAPVVRRVIATGPLRIFELDFEQRLRTHIEALVNALEKDRQ